MRLIAILTGLMLFAAGTAQAASSSAYAVFKGRYSCEFKEAFGVGQPVMTTVSSLTLKVAKNGKFTGTATIYTSGSGAGQDPPVQTLRGKLTKYKKRGTQFTARASSVFYDATMKALFNFSALKFNRFLGRSAYGTLTYQGEELAFTCL